jgi:hypothetical protein
LTGPAARRILAGVRLRSAWEWASEIGSDLFVAAWLFVFAVLLLMLLGAGLLDLSKAVHLPLPSVHDDPNRVEVAGLLVLVGYGLAVAAAAVGGYAAVRAARGLPFMPPEPRER